MKISNNSVKTLQIIVCLRSTRRISFHFDDDSTGRMFCQIGLGQIVRLFGFLMVVVDSTERNFQWTIINFTDIGELFLFLKILRHFFQIFNCDITCPKNFHIFLVFRILVSIQGFNSRLQFKASIQGFNRSIDFNSRLQSINRLQINFNSRLQFKASIQGFNSRLQFKASIQGFNSRLQFKASIDQSTSNRLQIDFKNNHHSLEYFPHCLAI